MNPAPKSTATALTWALLSAAPVWATAPEELPAASAETSLSGVGAAPPGGFVREWTMKSAQIGENRLTRIAQVNVAVHATRGWQTCRVSGSTCRVLLYLPGFDGSPQASYLGPMFGLRNAVDQQVASGKLPPMVVVIVDPRTVLGGCFYTDSPISGRWASFLTQELLPEVERNLAIADGPRRRWVAGHSMGGFGALHLAFLQPEAWQGALAISPVAGPAFALGSRLKAAVAGLRQDPGRVDALAAKPSGQGFSERLFWSMAAAWTSAGRADQWQQAIDLEGEGKVSAPAWADWQRLDPATQAAGNPKVCRLRRLVLTVGRKDPLIAAADVSAVGAALLHRCKSSSQLTLAIHNGNHGNRVRQDLIDGLGALAGGN